MYTVVGPRIRALSSICFSPLPFPPCSHRVEVQSQPCSEQSASLMSLSLSSSIVIHVHFSKASVAVFYSSPWVFDCSALGTSCTCSSTASIDEYFSLCHVIVYCHSRIPFPTILAKSSWHFISSFFVPTISEPFDHLDIQPLADSHVRGCLCCEVHTTCMPRMISNMHRPSMILPDHMAIMHTHQLLHMRTSLPYDLVAVASAYQHPLIAIVEAKTMPCTPNPKSIWIDHAQTLFAYTVGPRFLSNLCLKQSVFT